MEISLPILMCGARVCCPFLVVKGLKRDILIGRDIMTPFDVKFDFKRATASLNIDEVLIEEQMLKEYLEVCENTIESRKTNGKSGTVLKIDGKPSEEGVT